MRWDNARGETAGGASETTGEAGSAETTGQAGSAPDLNWPGRRRVRRSAAMELLRTRDEAEQREARRPDDAPMLSRHSATLSRHLVWVRRLLREYLAELAEDSLSVPMQRTSRGLHPTMRWTVEFGKWLATTRIVESRACNWHLAEEQSAGLAYWHTPYTALAAPWSVINGPGVVHFYVIKDPQVGLQRKKARVER